MVLVGFYGSVREGIKGRGLKGYDRRVIRYEWPWAGLSDPEVISEVQVCPYTSMNVKGVARQWKCFSLLAKRRLSNVRVVVVPPW